jgi:uncharacterized protein YtpQ (UPF0354 family)
MKNFTILLLFLLSFSKVTGEEPITPETKSKKSLDKIVPRIYIDLPTNPKVKEVQLTKDDSPVSRNLIGNIILFYAFDMDTHFEIVSNKDLHNLKLSKEELHIKAVKNLNSLDLQIKAQKSTNLNMLTAGGNYEATLILLPEIMDSISSMVDGNLIVSVPARDILYFTGDKDPENIKAITEWTNKMTKEADKPLSNILLKRVSGSWETYKPEKK